MQEVMTLLAELSSRDIKLKVKGERLTCHAPQGALTQELRSAIGRLKPGLIRVLSDRSGGHIAASESPQEFPLSVGQRSHYLLQRWHVERSHVVATCLRMSNDIDQDVLAAAWDRVVSRFPILSARIVERDGEPFHVIDGRSRPSMTREALNVSDDDAVIAQFQARAQEPFHLERGPLARATVFTQADGRAGLFVVVHHIIFDGQSVGILLRTLFDAYDRVIAGDPPVAAADSVYRWFVAWESSMLVSDEGHRHHAYWQHRLAQERPTFKLLPEHSRSFDALRCSSVFLETLPAGLSDRIRQVCQEHGLQPSVFFLTLYFVLLYKHSAQDDLTVLMPVMVRPDKVFLDEIGYFFNVVPIRVRFANDWALPELFREIQMAVMDGVFHSAIPFARMLDRQRSDANVPFGLLYGFHEFSSLSGADFATVRGHHALEPVPGFHRRGEGDYEFALEVFEEQGAFRLKVQGDPKIHPDEMIRAALDRYINLLEQACHASTRRVGVYALATDADRDLVLRQWNATDTPYARDRRIQDFFMDRVAIDADAPAVRCGSQTLTYGGLEQASRQLAMYLQARGIGADRIVAICLERSIEMMIAILGIIRAGGAYMPIDPEYPDDRVAYMLADSESTIVLTQDALRERVADVAAESMQIVALDADWHIVEADAGRLVQQGEPLRDEITPENLVYVIYTSGSTGRPKGVLVEHRALVNRLQWMQKCYPLEPGDVVAQKTPYCFDVSVWEFLWTPTTGALLVFAAPHGHSDAQYMRRLVVQERVTTIHFTPSMFHTFLDHAGGSCPEVRHIFCSGEALDAESVLRYRDTFPNASLHNLYGPTEAAIDVTSFDCTQLDYDFVPIGRPIDNTRILILDDHGNPQPPDVPGELHIAGVNLARGYLNQSELTAERFVANPFLPGERMYRTGDLARWLRDGNIQYLGRIDDQVKIGGVRIETGEIEAHMGSFPDIAACAVVPRNIAGYTQLIAFYRAHESTLGRLVTIPQADLRAHLLEMLPDYMVPAAFVSVTSIPVTGNGKTDRRALQQIEVRIESRERYEPPATSTEHELIAIWEHVLKEKGFVVEGARIGAHDNFFDLGGNSLLATHLIYTVRSQFGVELPIRALFEHVTIRSLAAQIDEMKAAR